MNIEKLLEQNKKWTKEIKEKDPDFFKKLSKIQNPHFLWIGCSDSRVAANELLNLLPGEVFVHRNIANQVVHSDLNSLSIIQYAVEILKVKHIIICGHYDCRGIKSAFKNYKYGLVDNWLRHVKDVYRFNYDEISKLENDKDKENRLCELNVIEQVLNVSHTTVVQNAWQNNQELAVHGWIFSIEDGILKDLNTSITGLNQLSHPHNII